MGPLSRHNSLHSSLSLVDLATRVVEQEDRPALEEILNRTPFHSAERSRLRLTEYLETLRIWASGKTWRSVKSFETADKAYDMTLDKFSNITVEPGSSEKKLQSKRSEMKRNGPDCRLYWRAFLEHVKQDFEKDPPAGHLEAEKRAAASLQRFVRRHFFLSLLEAERAANEFWSRYNWRVGNRSIILWLPRFLKGAERRKWLEKTIRDPDPDRPKERERIQRIIAGRFATMAYVPLQDGLNEDPTGAILNELLGRSQFEFSLARFVADEKSADIENQRRSIKNLGAEKLKQLVLRIFEDLDAGTFQDHRIAEDFGLSKSTFSRFAGSQWQASGTDKIPDLWLNTAQVLSTRPEFKEAAVEAGVWGEVEKALKKANRN